VASNHEKTKLFNQLTRVTFGTQGWLAGRRWTCHSRHAGYGVAGTWSASYGVAGIPVVGDVLLPTGPPFTVEILVNTPMCCMFS
jgi:hypothetical protein